MENPFNSPSLWDVPRVQSFQSFTETRSHRNSVGLSHHLSRFISAFAPFSLFFPLFYICLWQSLCSSVLLRFAAPGDRMTKRSHALQTLQWGATVKEFVPKKRVDSFPRWLSAKVFLEKHREADIFNGLSTYTNQLSFQVNHCRQHFKPPREEMQKQWLLRFLHVLYLKKDRKILRNQCIKYFHSVTRKPSSSTFLLLL